MREFILLALKAPTSEFDINLLREAGRMDTVCRTISNSMFVSMHLRKDTNIHVCLNGPSLSPKIVSFFGEFLVGMDFDEKAIAEVLNKALVVGKNLELGQEKEVQAGVIVTKKAFETLIREKFDDGARLFYLDEKGEDLRAVNFNLKENNVFILGDFKGVPKNTEKLLKRLEAKKLVLGPVMLFASHCPIIVHNELDRREFG
jgi:tRNA (pseudouridine54-N1)-methyltransferase